VLDREFQEEVIMGEMFGVGGTEGSPTYRRCELTFGVDDYGKKGSITGR
jgi:hypothetical protein